MRLLLEAGSKTDVCESKSRQSPLYVAVQHQLVEAVQLLINAGKSSQSCRHGQRRLQKFSDRGQNGNPPPVSRGRAPMESGNKSPQKLKTNTQ